MHASNCIVMSIHKGGMPAVHPHVVAWLSERGITRETHEIAYCGDGPYSAGLPTKELVLDGQRVILTVVKRISDRPMIAYGVPGWEMSQGPWWRDPAWERKGREEAHRKSRPSPRREATHRHAHPVQGEKPQKKREENLSLF